MRTGPILVRSSKSRFVAIALAVQFTGAAYAQKSAEATYGPSPKLPPPAQAKVKNFSTAGKWAAGAAPKALDSFKVTRFAEGLVSPRWLYVLSNGDVLVAEASTKSKPPKTEEDKEKQRLLRQAGNMRESADHITLLRDSDATE